MQANPDFRAQPIRFVPKSREKLGLEARQQGHHSRTASSPSAFPGPCHVPTVAHVDKHANTLSCEASGDDFKLPPQPPATGESHMTTVSDFLDKPKHRPQPLDLSSTHRYGQVLVERRNIDWVHNKVTPDKVEFCQATGTNPPSSSVYTDEAVQSDITSLSPLHVPQKAQTSVEAQQKRDEELHFKESYGGWKEENTPPDTMVDSMIDAGVASQATHPTSIAKSATTANILNNDRHAELKTYSPLTPFLPGSARVRVASKTLFGDNGWLENTAAPVKKAEPAKSGGFMASIKKRTSEIVDKANLKSYNNNKRRETPLLRYSKLIVSLGPREQSLLYCELGFTLSNSLDDYIKSQLNCGRLDPGIHKKITDYWARKGWPRVSGFRFDLETQIELVSAHLSLFRFYGPNQGNPATIRGILYAMRGNARVMQHHTYCHPNSVIAKHILDAQVLFDLLGSAEHYHLVLEELSQFFKSAVDKDELKRHKALHSLALPPQKYCQKRERQDSSATTVDTSIFGTKSQLNLTYSPSTPAISRLSEHGNGSCANLPGPRRRSPPPPPKPPIPPMPIQVALSQPDTPEMSEGSAHRPSQGAVSIHHTLRHRTEALPPPPVPPLPAHIQRQHMARTGSPLAHHATSASAPAHTVSSCGAGGARDEKRQFSGPTLQPVAYDPNNSGDGYKQTFR